MSRILTASRGIGVIGGGGDLRIEKFQRANGLPIFHRSSSISICQAFHIKLSPCGRRVLAARHHVSRSADGRLAPLIVLAHFWPIDAAPESMRQQLADISMSRPGNRNNGMSCTRLGACPLHGVAYYCRPPAFMARRERIAEAVNEPIINHSRSIISSGDVAA